ncbi:MAG: hypothetical protein AB1405_14620 [Bdellovibrionota bacterium]
MKTLKAHVENGRVVLDEPLDLPEGTPLQLIVDEGDDLDPEERAARDASIEKGYAEYLAGKGEPVEKLIAELKSRR